MTGTCALSGSGITSTSGADDDDLGHPVRLVRRDQVDPPLRAPVVVPARDEFGRLELGDQPRDRVERAADGVDRRAVGRGDGVGDAVEGAEVDPGGVEQHAAIGHVVDPIQSNIRSKVW